MPESAHVIETRIAKLRERMRNTLDRSKQADIRAQIMEEKAKFEGHGGSVEDARGPGRGGRA